MLENHYSLDAHHVSSEVYRNLASALEMDYVINAGKQYLYNRSDGTYWIINPLGVVNGQRGYGLVPAELEKKFGREAVECYSWRRLGKTAGIIDEAKGNPDIVAALINAWNTIKIPHNQPVEKTFSTERQEAGWMKSNFDTTPIEQYDFHAKVANEKHNDDTPATYEEALELIADEIVELICDKHHDYGHENLKKHGEFGMVVRVSDKISRIENTLNSPAFVNESREDSWRDIVGYGFQALMLQRGYLDLPTSEM